MNDFEYSAPAIANGNQTIAWAAQDAGVQYVSHYPGSPVNLVVPELEKTASDDIQFNHALNEHIAALSALGASCCGARSLLVMKHVGLNIAADPLNYAGVCKIRGGMVVVVGTDPGARSSTGEEDVHWYTPQFNFPLYEPTDIQSLYDVIQNAFTVSEQINTPVLVFVPGRLAYQSNTVSRDRTNHQPQALYFDKDPQTYINVGKRAVKNHREHVQRIQAFSKQPSNSLYKFNEKAKFGLVTRGATYSIVCEVVTTLGLEDDIAVLNINQTYPLNINEFIQFAKNKTEICVIEDQDGFLETMIKRDAFGAVECLVEGKNYFPAWDEVSNEQVTEYLQDKFKIEKNVNSNRLFDIDCPDRPGTMCEGCPHRAAFYAIDRALENDNGIVGGDIGCSSLPPHRTDWLLCMNAGVGMTQGITQMLPQRSIVSSGGEGSLFHGGITSLQSAVENNINLTHVLFDNASIAMTGHQSSPSANSKVDVQKLLEAIGVIKVFEVVAYKTHDVIDAIEHAKNIHGVKVVWVRGNCALQADADMQRRMRERTLEIDNALCGSCTICYEQLQCPAITKSSKDNLRVHHLEIDMNRCRRCTACLDVCPNNAIKVNDAMLHVRGDACAI